MKAVYMHNFPGIHTGERVYLFESFEQAEQFANDLLEIVSPQSKNADGEDKNHHYFWFGLFVGATGALLSIIWILIILSFFE